MRAKLIIVVLSLSLFSCRSTLEYRVASEELADDLIENRINFQIGYYKAIGRQIRYLAIDNKAPDNLILIHGAPGSISKYNEFYTDSSLRKNYNIYVIDRPGYGYSAFGRAETSIDKNVEALLPLFDVIENKEGKNIVLGQSYGGPIAARLAMKHADLVDGLMLVCPAIEPGQEKTYKISYLMVKQRLKWLFPKIYVVASEEKLAHKRELEKIKDGWSLLKCPVTMMQGLKDKLIYPSNIRFLSNNVNNNLLEIIPLKDETHFMGSENVHRKKIQSIINLKKRCKEKDCVSETVIIN